MAKTAPSRARRYRPMPIGAPASPGLALENRNPAEIDEPTRRAGSIRKTRSWRARRSVATAMSTRPAAKLRCRIRRRRCWGDRCPRRPAGSGRPCQTPRLPRPAPRPSSCRGSGCAKDPSGAPRSRDRQGRSRAAPCRTRLRSPAPCDSGEGAGGGLSSPRRGAGGLRRHRRRTSKLT